MAVSKGIMCTRHFLRQQKWFLKCLFLFFIPSANFSAREFAVCKAAITSISLFHKAGNTWFAGEWFFSLQPAKENENTRSKAWTPSCWPGAEFHHAPNLQTDGSETSQRNMKKTKSGLQQIMSRLIEKMWKLECSNSCSRRVQISQLSVFLTALFSGNLHFKFSLIHPSNLLLFLAKKNRSDQVLSTWNNDLSSRTIHLLWFPANQIHWSCEASIMTRTSWKFGCDVNNFTHNWQ